MAITIYGLTLLAIRLLSAALDAYARREHLYSPQEEGQELWSAQRKLLPAIIGYVITIAIGLLVPRAAVALYLCLAVYQIVPFGEMTRLLFRRSWLPATPRTLWQAGIPSTSMSGNGWPSGPRGSAECRSDCDAAARYRPGQCPAASAGPESVRGSPQTHQPRPAQEPRHPPGAPARLGASREDEQEWRGLFLPSRPWSCSIPASLRRQAA